MSYTFLVADDLDLVRIAHRAYLESDFPNSTVHVVEDGQQAIDKLDELNGGVDLVVTDNQMPIKGGFDVIKYVRAHYSSVPVIMVATDMSRIKESALQEGAAEFLDKPLGPDTLCDAIKRVLNIE